jgi:N6-L-threonylcarbamoyladenine synthase
MKILSIETSCDETGISIIDCKGGLKNPSFNVLANNLNSQIKIHAPYGGVFPALAKREHLKNLPILLEKTLKDSKLEKKKKPFDLVTVTYGPGLEPALWTGIVFAKELAEKYKVPIIPVNHMEGHMLSVFAKNKGLFKIPKIEFPTLSLLVSGGHTELVIAKEWMKYKIIGETLDDAAGEAFDKVARMLELPYPGGPEISKLAETERKSSSPRKDLGEEIKLPRPMMYSKNFDFSFSGLKTAVLYLIRDLKKENPNVLENEEIKMAIAKEFEDAVVETLVHKTKKAIEKYNIKTIIVAGGVSANKYLKKEMLKITNPKQELLFPGKDLSGDNSIMIGVVGYLKFLNNDKKGVNLKNIKAQGGLKL